MISWDLMLSSFDYWKCSPENLPEIVGMGGLGKTTLTKHGYEHSHSQHHFDVRLWATISQEYTVEHILNQLLFHDSRNDSELGLQLHKMLWGTRYLIVLDDMWSDGAWDEIPRFLPNNENGSCVVVTTRLSNLAARLSSCPFEMDFLDDDQSWELFCGRTLESLNCYFDDADKWRDIVQSFVLPTSLEELCLQNCHWEDLTKMIKSWIFRLQQIQGPEWDLAEEELEFPCLKINIEDLWM